MDDTRLIERWLPMAALSEECARERRSMTALPPIYYLHVWWARRPLVASRAAVLASLLPADADRDKFMHAIGIHGDPVATRRKIDAARARGERFEGQAYSYPRAFSYAPHSLDSEWIAEEFRGKWQELKVLDPTAGGGSIPFEATRLGLANFANDLNPVATIIMTATVNWPANLGADLSAEFESLGKRYLEEREARLSVEYPPEPTDNAIATNWLWARTITCPYCSGLVPLSPNWRLAPGGMGVRLIPQLREGPGSSNRVCRFEIVDSADEQSNGTVARGDGTCPFDDCGRVIDGDEIKRQAQDGGLGEQLYAVVYKKRVPGKTLKSGKRGKDKWERGYRTPRPEDDNSAEIAARLAEKLPEWEAFDYIPSERFPTDANDDRPIQYGMPLWRDLFSPRQLLCHGTSVEIYREMLEEDRRRGRLDEVRKAAYGYLALTLDKLLNYNARMTRWHSNRRVLAGTFDRHDFAFKWSYAEMAPLVSGVGYDWAVEQTAKCIKELVELIRPEDAGADAQLFQSAPPVTVTCKPGDQLDHIESASVDLVVMDPPYYDNVMYAELSDFFYVWLKRTAGHVFPELFRRALTDKDNEAVANPARHKSEKGAAALAARDYRERMAAIFAECRRVLKPDGLMTLMFTHKATGAWDALTTGLMESGFAITASWPVNTEAGGSLHIKDKAAAKSTVLLVCRPKAVNDDLEVRDQAVVYWEDVAPRVAVAVRRRMDEFSEAGIGGVDLFLAAFGPALEEFSRHWPLQRGTPREMPAARRRRRQMLLFEEEWDLTRRRRTMRSTPPDARCSAGDWNRSRIRARTRASIPPPRSWCSPGTPSRRRSSPTTKRSTWPAASGSISKATSWVGWPKSARAICGSGTAATERRRARSGRRTGRGP